MLTRSPLSDSDREKLVRLIFPDYDTLPTLQELEAKYPIRNLPEGACVNRVAPSPTGFAHIGLIYTAIMNRALATQSGGVFMLRIEDTDSKREVEGADQMIVDALSGFDQTPDEGFVPDGAGMKECGAYGPYMQSARKNIYRAAAAHFMREGFAYPCFATEEELKDTVAEQTARKLRPGYYGTYARWRDRTVAEVEAELAKGSPFVVRFRCGIGPREKVNWKDGVKGSVTMPAHDLDSVILKSDGNSLYHLAHLVDDHFMRVTHVIRGDEWLSSMPFHIQLYQAFGWEAPHFSHVATIQKLEQVTEVDEATGKEVTRNSKRKLSKRKDPEADVTYYHRSGFPKEGVIEYLLNLLNSNFEDWRRANPSLPYRDFKVSIEKLSTAGALADTVKLSDICKDVISRWSASKLLNDTLDWAERFDKELFEVFSRDKAYSEKVLSIERGGPRPTRRIGTFGDVKAQFGFLFDSYFKRISSFDFPEQFAKDVGPLITDYIPMHNPALSKEEWFAMCKDLAEKHGFAREVKLFKQEPGKYKGHVGDVTMLLRIAISGSKETPDLYEAMQVLGKEETVRRLGRFGS